MTQLPVARGPLAPRFAERRLARIGVVTLAFLALGAIFADMLASDLPIFCRYQGRFYVVPNVVGRPALEGQTCASMARSSSSSLGPRDFSVCPPVRHGPTSSDPDALPLAPPSLRSGHPFGTDAYRRDVFARLVHGARTSLGFGILTVLGFVAVGSLLGAAAGFLGGVVDFAVTRLVEVTAALPTLILVLVVQAIVPHPSAVTMLMTIAASRWTEIARMVRAEVLFATTQDYVLSARALGASPWRILTRHILPNVAAAAVTTIPFGVASVLLIEAAMDFLHLGIGLHAPTPSWGEVLSEARVSPGAYWLLVFPGLLLFLSLMALTLVGEAPPRRSGSPPDPR